MIVVLIGCSGVGKSTLEKILSERFGYKKIVSYTTRRPRVGEVFDKDYHFITNEKFEKMLNQGLFAEYDEYSQKRFYGTAKEDYESGNKVVVLTPNGLRQLKKNCPNEKIFTVLVTATVAFANIFTIIEPAINGDMQTTVWSIVGPVLFTAIALILHRRYENRADH
jgi:guanylate kinase